MAYSHVPVFFPTSSSSYVPNENFRKKRVRDFTSEGKQQGRMKATITTDSTFQRVLWFLFRAVSFHFHENLNVDIEEKKTHLGLGPVWDLEYKWNFSEKAVLSSGLTHWLVVTILLSTQCHLTFLS